MIDSIAYRRFLASAPGDQREFRTIEIFHPDFSEILRFVEDQVDRQLTLNTDAPRNAGELVTFTSISMKVTEPKENRDADQVLTVNLGAVGNEVEDQIDLITPDGFLTQIEVIYRKYYSGDIGQPVVTLSLSAGTLSFNNYDSVSFSAEDTDFVNKSSGETYDLNRFPGLSDA
ncbi:DUF1833 family protein [Candidatus Pacearchaeota archaeon]|nr:DUF1833 family protein [Candidatus Pacearchaeota archaeon]